MIKVSETRSALRRMALTKTAFSAPAVGGKMVASGIGTLGTGLGLGVGASTEAGLFAPAVSGGVGVGAPLLAGGAGVLAGDLMRRGADVMTGAG